MVAFGSAIDYSLPADDFSYPLAVLYAEQIGLPVGMIICNCMKTHEVWNLLHRGEISLTACSDALVGSFERLRQLRLGAENTKISENVRTYQVASDAQDKIREGFFCVVSGADRALQMVTASFRSTGSILTPDAALCVAGIGDYRAKNGDIRFTMVIEEDSPTMFTDEIASATGLSAEKIGAYLKE
jgi:hypothetical protein